jgi:hypothetical protein
VEDESVKTCETCKHWNWPTKQGWGDCFGIPSASEIDVLTYGYPDETDNGYTVSTHKNFGCAIHEEKDA